MGLLRVFTSFPINKGLFLSKPPKRNPRKNKGIILTRSFKDFGPEVIKGSM